MARHLQEAAVVLALLAEEDQINGGLEIVVDATTGNAVPEPECPPVRIEDHLLRFAQIRHGEKHPAVREAQVRDLDLLHLPAKLDRLVAPVELIRFTRSEGERDEHLPAAPLAFTLPSTHRALQRRIRAWEAFLDQCVEEALPVAPLAQRPPRVLAQ